MLERVMLDAKLGLFGVLLAFAIATSSSEGINPDSPDFLVISWKESITQSAPSIQSVGPNGAKLIKPYWSETQSQSGDRERCCIAVVFPAESGGWTVSFQNPTSEVAIRTRQGPAFGPQPLRAKEPTPTIQTR